MTDLSVWAHTDWARALREIEEQHGSAIFDSWSFIDRTRAAAQMTEALGVEITSFDMLSRDALLARVQAALSGGGGGSGSGSDVTAYSAEAQQFFDRLITPPNSTDAPLYATLIDTLVSGGVWAKLDVLDIFAAADSGTSLINLKSASFQPFLDMVTGPPTFTANVGWSGGGGVGSQDVNLNFNPSTAGGNYTRDDACIGGWKIGTAAESKALIVNISASGALEIWPQGALTYFAVNTNGTEIGTAHPTPVDGWWHAQRTASNAQAFYHNNVAFASSATASAALVNESLVTNLILNKTAANWIGASLTSGQMTTLFNALTTFLTAKGAI